MKFSVRTVLSAAILLCAGTVALPQRPRQKPQLQEIASGKTRVIDLSYALSDKLVPWPGDAKAFEAKVNATVEKNGYFTRSFWMLEHYGTHMDAPAHFPPGITTVDKIPVERFFGRRHCSVADRVGFALAGRFPISQSGCERHHAFSGIFRGRGKITAGAENQRIGLRHVEHRSGKRKGFSGASRGAGRGSFSAGKFSGFEGFARGRGVFDRRADQIRRRIGRSGAGVCAGGGEVVG